MKAVETFTTDFESTLDLPDDNLNLLRRESFEEFKKHGLPTRKEEYWKYSDPSIISNLELEFVSSGQYEDENYDVILVNGKIVKRFKDCQMGDISEGLRSGNLGEDLFEKKDKPFLNLNNAFAINGCYLI